MGAQAAIGLTHVEDAVGIGQGLAVAGAWESPGSEVGGVVGHRKADALQRRLALLRLE